MTTLPQQIATTIRQDGQVPFARLMEMALYSEYGYYNGRVRIGRRGADFFTASQSPLFAMALAHAVEETWENWGKPDSIQIVEVGAGQGELAENIMREIQKSGRIAGLTYCIYDRSSKMLELQRARLQDVSQKASFHFSWDQPCRDLPTMIIANEILDAQPVEYLRRTQTGWELLAASVSDSDDTDTVDWTWREADSEAVELANSYVNCPVGTYAEICRTYGSLLADAMGGYTAPIEALWFDYGIFKEEWEAGIRPKGTLRAYQEHELVDPLTHLFEADLTADTNWTYAEAVGRSLGLTTELMTQGHFLLQHDIMERAVELQQSEPTLLAGNHWTQQLKQLALPGGMGDRFSVLVCRRP